ncbi:MAG: sugar phosphate isomerase/epimerase family protein [Anaerolineae bacterium]
MPTEEFIRAAAGIGYRGVELRDGQIYLGMPEDELARVRAALSATGVRCVFLSPSIGLESEDELAQFGDYLRYAVALDAAYIRLGVTEASIPYVRRAADAAAAVGRGIICQIHTNSITDSIEAAVAVAERIGRPNFGITFEPGNFILMGLDYGPEAIKRLGQHLFNVSFQDIKPVPETSGEGVLVYEGKGFRRCLVGDPAGVDVALMSRALEETGYQGFVTVIEPVPAAGMSSLELARYIHDRFLPYV